MVEQGEANGFDLALVFGADAGKFALYARREETRRDHIARLMVYLAARSATGQDRRAALLAAIQAATMSDDGGAIASATVAMFRERGSLLPAIDTIERIGLAARAIARRRAERALIEEISVDTLQSLDKLLDIAPTISLESLWFILDILRETQMPSSRLITAEKDFTAPATGPIMIRAQPRA